MKKLAAVLCLLVMAALFPANAAAEPGIDAKIIQAFGHDGVLYAYVDITGKNEMPLTVEANLGGERFAQEKQIITVAENKTPVHTMFLVDISSSMPAYRKPVETFIESFMKEAGEAGISASFLLATFGKEFQSVGEFTQNADEVMKALKDFTYDVQQTGLYAGISDAIDHFARMGRDKGEIYEIIVLSDGIEVDKNGVTFDEIVSRITGSNVILHTFGFPNNGRGTKAEKDESEQALKNLGVYARTSSGLHNVMGYDRRTEAEIAKEIAGYMGGLYVTEFLLSSFQSNGGEYPLTLYFKSGSDLIGKADENVKVPMTLTQTLPPAQRPTTVPVPSAAPMPGTTQIPTATPPDITGSPDSPGSGEEEQETEQKSLTNYFVIGGVVILALALALAGLYFIARKKKPATGKASAQSGIFMKLEVLQGDSAGMSSEFYLQNELLVGRDRDCDIIFRDKDVSGRNSRIFTRDGVIYIEDLGSKNGTAISDMKLHAPNRLRSGDVISIGHVKFNLKF